MALRAAVRICLITAATSSGFRVAVVQHNVIAGSTDAETIILALASYENATRVAAAGGAGLAVFPEFALGMDTAACVSPTAPSVFCEPIPFAIGTAPCDAANASSLAPIQVATSCSARAHGIAVAINSCESAPAAGGGALNYNVELVYGADGKFLAQYRKTHPFFTSCFETPAAPELVTLNLPGFAYSIGVFTCFDILFPTPGPTLVSAGVRHFIYSAAIPLVGSAAQELWTAVHASTLFGSNLQDGQTGVYANGTRLTSKPPSGLDAVLFADV